MSKVAPTLFKRASAIHTGASSSSRTVLGARQLPNLRPTCQTLRYNSTQSAPFYSVFVPRRRKISPIFWIAIGTMLLIPTYEFVEYLANARAYPSAVRKHLREALRARKKGAIPEADALFQKAIQAAIALPFSAFTPDALLKLSGLFAEYASFLETNGNPVMAYEQLVTALDLFGQSPLHPDPHRRIASEWAESQELSRTDHLRAIVLNQKLGQLALQLANSAKVHPYPKSLEGGPTTFLDAAELHLSSALTALLRIGLPSEGAKSVDPNQAVVVGRDVDLAGGSEGLADRQGLGITMEALAEVYAKKGQIKYAQQLLVQAISTLIPPDQAAPPLLDQCQAAILMTSVSTHASQSTSQNARKISRSWALRALEMSNAAVDEAKGTKEQDEVKQSCGRAATVALFNLGMLAEMNADTPTALDTFSKSLARAREINFRQGELQSAEAIKRIRYAGSKWEGT